MRAKSRLLFIQRRGSKYGLFHVTNIGAGGCNCYNIILAFKCEILYNTYIDLYNEYRKEIFGIWLLYYLADWTYDDI